LNFDWNLYVPGIDLADGVGVDARGDPNCIIHALCDLYDGISVEAKTIKEFWLKPKIRNMIEQGVSLTNLCASFPSFPLIILSLRIVL